MMLARLQYPGLLRPLHLPLLQHSPTLCPLPPSPRLKHYHHPHSSSSSSSSFYPPSSLFSEENVALSRQRLRQELFDLIDATEGSLNADCVAIIESLQRLYPNLDIRANPHLYSGCFEGVRSSFKGTGRKGETNKNVGTSGSSVTLGRATFNSLKPRDLDITIKKTYNHVAVEEQDSYILIIEFEVVDPNAGGEVEIIEGLLMNKAKFSIASPTRMNVVFDSTTMAIRNPDDGLDRWLKLFKDANPDMDERGSITVPLPPAKGHLDYLFIDEDLRITRGNRGGVAVVRRIAEPVVHLCLCWFICYVNFIR